MRLAIYAVFLSLLTTQGTTADLYCIFLHSPTDATLANSLNIKPILQIEGGYLILVEPDGAQTMLNSIPDAKLIVGDVSIDDLAVDRSRRPLSEYSENELIFEQKDLKLVRIDRSKPSSYTLAPLRPGPIKMRYTAPHDGLLPGPTSSFELGDIMPQISQDSLESYVHRLEAFTTRLAGTDSNYAARDWIAAKFASFGYDSVTIDPFQGSQLWDYFPVQCYNVIAFKPGSVYPDKQIVIGAHFDAVPDCPGADDNASGTATVLELARVLQDVVLPMSVTFIAFDSEESWMYGSYHYADNAVARGDDIVLMINPDMIAHLTNSDKAKLYYGEESGYAGFWIDMAEQYAGITGYYSGSTASDHLPFQEAGYDVIFVQEYNFSTNYHDPSDISANLNFDYMTRMVQATLATAYNVASAPPPVHPLAIDQPGDGNSLLVRWQPIISSEISEYRIYYRPMEPTPGDLRYVSAGAADSTLLLTGLDEGINYEIFVMAYNQTGMTSIVHDVLYGRPLSHPVLPDSLTAWPLHDAVRLDWQSNNKELDFSHYAILRDGATISMCADTSFVDNDPSLGGDFHDYRVVAVDTDGNYSDTVGAAPVPMRAATLEPDRILAVNRSSNTLNCLVDEVRTGVFMRDALAGYNFDYFSDTAATSSYNNPNKIHLMNMLDYGLLVFGSEGGHVDAIGGRPDLGGILDTLAYYLSIGGKLVLYGRWGDINASDTLDYLANGLDFDDAYHDLLGIDFRVQTASIPVAPDTLLSDFTGAHSLMSGYPDIAWDSAATSQHSLPFRNPSGVPFATWVHIGNPDFEPIYTYESRTGDPSNQGGTVAWRYLGQTYSLTCFDFPVSFMQYSTAVQILRKAVDDMQALPTDNPPPDNGNLPGEFSLSQNYPNPFNPTTVIEYSLPKGSDVELVVFNLLGQRVRTLVDKRQPAGTFAVTWDGRSGSGNSVTSGIYLYRLTAGQHSASRKMLLIK